MIKKPLVLLFLFALVCSLGFSAARKIWLARTLEKLNQTVYDLGQKFSKDNRALAGFLEQQSNALYVVGVWSPHEFKSGFVNEDILNYAPQAFRDVFPSAQWASLEKTLDKNMNLSSDYVHAVHIQFQQPVHPGETVRVGELKAAFLLPGVLTPGIHLGRAYSYLLSLLWLATAFIGGMCAKEAFAPSGRRSKKPSLPPFSEDIEDIQSELTWLETDTGVTQPIYVDDKGRSWSVLFPSPTLHQWTTRGDFYVREHQLVLKPWGTHLVRQDVHAKSSFEYLVRAYKLAGPDGFIVSFVANGHQLYWILGGWGGKKSELAGYPTTSKSHKISCNVWHLIELRSKQGFLEGFVNGERFFKLDTSEIKQSSPDLGMEKGFGVAVWHSLAKYTDIRLFTDE